MAKLIYTVITSLDGYVADDDGNFGWAEPDEEVHWFVNEHERPIGTYLLGRRLYETMVVWDDDVMSDGQPAVVQDYAEIWRAADKVVYSTTLASVSSPKARLERAFDVEAVRAMKQNSERDVSIGGPGLAAHALEAGLVDECSFFLNPVVIGSGNPSLPAKLSLALELVDEHRFGNGVVYVQYRVRN